jgi:DNA-binding transcriptional LysR family regulator
VELRHLEYFVAVAAELSSSRAAQRIHVVQSALSTSVSKLEKELGVELFDRSKRQITLTAAGEVSMPTRLPSRPAPQSMLSSTRWSITSPNAAGIQ